MNKPYRFLIVGAGALGRQALSKALDVPADARDWEIGGFLDSRPGILDGYNRRYGILGDPMTFDFSENDRIVCAIANPQARLEYCEKLARRGARFTNLIHPTAMIDRDCRLGTGCMIGPLAAIDCDVTLGNHVMVYGFCGIGHDTVVGDGCSLSMHTIVAGGCRLGRGVFIGTNATVNETTEFGDYASLAAGSVASGRIPAKAVMMGIPARPIRQWARLLKPGKSE